MNCNYNSSSCLKAIISILSLGYPLSPRYNNFKLPDGGSSPEKVAVMHWRTFRIKCQLFFTSPKVLIIKIILFFVVSNKIIPLSQFCFGVRCIYTKTFTSIKILYRQFLVSYNIFLVTVLHAFNCSCRLH